MKYVIEFDEIISINEAVGSSITKWVDSGKVSKAQFDNLLSLDPAKGKSIDKIISWITDGHDMHDVVDAIKRYWSLRNKKKIETDLIRYKSLQELKEDLNKKFAELYSSGTDSWKKYGKLTYNVIQDDDNIFAAKINSLADSVYFGDKNGWCVGDASRYDVEEHYSNYDEDDHIMIYVFDKNKSTNSNYSKLLLYGSEEFKEFKNKANNAAVDKKYLKSIYLKSEIISQLQYRQQLDYSKLTPQQIVFIEKFNDLVKIRQKDIDNMVNHQKDGKLGIYLENAIPYDLVKVFLDHKSSIYFLKDDSRIVDMQHMLLNRVVQETLRDFGKICNFRTINTEIDNEPIYHIPNCDHIMADINNIYLKQLPKSVTSIYLFNKKQNDDKLMINDHIENIRMEYYDGVKYHLDKLPKNVKEIDLDVNTGANYNTVVNNIRKEYEHLFLIKVIQDGVHGGIAMIRK